MDKIQTLTLEEIDPRIVENSARLEVIAGELEKKASELGSARGWKLPTNLINKAIDNLKHERRELAAEQEFLKQERQNIERATAQKAAEVAAAEYNALLEELNPRAVEIIKGLCTVQTQLLDLEKIQVLMKKKAASAGKLADPIPYDSTIVILVDAIGAHVYSALSQITAFNGRENVEKFIHIPDPGEERDKTSARLSRGYLAAAERVSPEPSRAPKTFMEAARKAAGLPFE